MITIHDKTIETTQDIPNQRKKNPVPSSRGRIYEQILTTGSQENKTIGSKR